MLYASGQRSRKQIRYFEYQPDCSGKHPAALLKEFRGCLVTNGYAGYDKVPHAVRCGCWAHMRRKWREAMPKGADSSAVIYSLVESVKANDLEPRSYLWFLLDEMRYLNKSPSAAKLDALMPCSPGIRKLLEKEYS